nr:hypothetical protein [Tanacetum cinerariifolium]
GQPGRRGLFPRARAGLSAHRAGPRRAGAGLVRRAGPAPAG